MVDLSVCIPYTHSDEHLLEEAVASVDLDCEIVTFLDEERRGAGWARNQAVAQSSHDWIVKMDADDRLDAGTLAKLYGLRHQGAMVATAASRFERDGEPTHQWEYDYFSTRPAALLTKIRTPASAGCLLYHRSVGPYPENCGAYEGWAFVCKAVGNGVHVVAARGTGYRHLLRDNSYWQQRGEHRQEDLRNAFAYVNEMYADAVGG